MCSSLKALPRKIEPIYGRFQRRWKSNTLNHSFLALTSEYASLSSSFSSLFSLSMVNQSRQIRFLIEISPPGEVSPILSSICGLSELTPTSLSNLIFHTESSFIITSITILHPLLSSSYQASSLLSFSSCLLSIPSPSLES